MNIDTKCVHGNNEQFKTDNTGSISFPIYQSATFAHPALGQSTGYDYSRSQNPTREHLEKLVAALESGHDAVAYSTGMAAVSALMEIFSPNDHIIASDDLYGGSIRLFNKISEKNGLKFNYVDTSNIPAIKNLINKNTKAIFVETPTNPMMNVTDLKEVSKLAKEYNLLLIVDNTFLSPYFQKPIELGADIVLHSGTKFLGGHNDTLAGFLVLANEELTEKIKFISKTTGAVLSPFDSWLIIRGIKTLSIRMRQQEQNSLKLADYLKNHSKVKKVFYVGLKDHPSYEVSIKQTTGFGSMIGFEVDSEETVKHILSNISIIKYAESLGGVESLITYPMTQTHADLTPEERENRGINEKFLRFSVGIENVDDLIEDLQYALGE
ncbi:MAG: cystathionine synthase [Bacillota bacterium]|nr:cystathionine synthase [Bacillota bacterium]